ncbi:MAG TPA: nickel-binding protein [Nitrososphaeraceae archaeon]|nr:nickel-binding protein [Nitrososphaeraceae archaeon]
MPIFLDVHKLPFKEDHLKELVNSPVDEFGVKHINLIYNDKNDVCFCLLDAPDHESVVKHHDKVDIQCEWIMEVNLAKHPIKKD